MELRRLSRPSPDDSTLAKLFASLWLTAGGGTAFLTRRLGDRPVKRATLLLVVKASGWQAAPEQGTRVRVNTNCRRGGGWAGRLVGRCRGDKWWQRSRWKARHAALTGIPMNVHE